MFEDEIYGLVDPVDNRFVMHIAETGTADLNVALPEGWTRTKIILDEPLEILPFGGGDAYYHPVLRDKLGPGYHQYIFAEDKYP